MIVIKEVSWVFKVSFKEVSRECQGCFKCFFEVSRVSECLKGVSRKFQENVQGDSKKFHVACNSLHTRAEGGLV